MDAGSATDEICLKLSLRKHVWPVVGVRNFERHTNSGVRCALFNSHDLTLAGNIFVIERQREIDIHLQRWSEF